MIASLLSTAAKQSTHINMLFKIWPGREQMFSWVSVKLVGKGLLCHLITKSSVLKESFPDFPQLLRTLLGVQHLLPPVYTSQTPSSLQLIPR